MVALYIAGFPAFYMAVDTLAKRLDKDKVGGFTWSRRTVCVVLRDLAALGVVTPSGYVSARGTRLRVLHPDVLPAKRESCTPAPRESCTQEVPKSTSELKRYSDTGTAAKNAAGQPPCYEFKNQEKPKPKPLIYLDILNALTRYCGGPELAEGLYWYIDRRIDAAGAQPRYMRYWLKAAENLFRQCPQHAAIAMATKWGFQPEAMAHWNEQSERWERGRCGEKTNGELEADYRAAQAQGARLSKRLASARAVEEAIGRVRENAEQECVADLESADDDKENETPDLSDYEDEAVEIERTTESTADLDDYPRSMPPRSSVDRLKESLSENENAKDRLPTPAIAVPSAPDSPIRVKLDEISDAEFEARKEMLKRQLAEILLRETAPTIAHIATAKEIAAQ